MWEDGKKLIFGGKYRIPPARAQWHEYGYGCYFVTICTKDRARYFGMIDPEGMKLSPLGIVAVNLIEELPKHIPQVGVLSRIVMPDHVHMILSVGEAEGQSPIATSFHRGPLTKAIGGYKAAVTKYAKSQGIAFAWQTRYYDHIIHNAAEYNAITDYIENNVRSWQAKYGIFPDVET